MTYLRKIFDYLKMTHNYVISLSKAIVSKSREISEQFSSTLELKLLSLKLQNKYLSYSEPFF